METLTQKTVTIEFEGRKYALQDEITLEEFLRDLGLPNNKTVTLRMTKDGLVLDFV